MKLRIDGISIERMDDGTGWKVTPIIIHSMRSETKVRAVYEFEDKSPSIQKNFEALPEKFGKRRGEEKAAISKGIFEGMVILKMYMGEELVSKFSFQFTSYHVEKKVTSIHLHY